MELTYFLFRHVAQNNMPVKNAKKMLIDITPNTPIPPMLLSTFSIILIPFSYFNEAVVDGVGALGATFVSEPSRCK